MREFEKVRRKAFRNFRSYYCHKNKEILARLALMGDSQLVHSLVQSFQSLVKRPFKVLEMVIFPMVIGKPCRRMRSPAGQKA